jgi:MarR family transcriptional regulator for hemolysin
MTKINDWDADLTWILMPVGRLWCRAVGVVFERMGVTLSEAAPILAMAKLGDGARQNVVAEQVGVDDAALVRSLDKLEGAGLIERRVDVADRRARTLHLTSEGRALAKRLDVALTAYLEQVFAQISDADGQAALRVLRAIETASLQTLDGSRAADNARELDDFGQHRSL